MKKYLPLIGIVFSAAAIALMFLAFYTKDLSESQWNIFRVVFALFGGLLAGCFVGTMKVENPLAGGLVTTATGGFAVWLASLYLLPGSSRNIVYVQLVQNDGGSPNGEFSIDYERRGLDAGTQTSSGGKATLSDVPLGSEKLNVLRLSHSGLRIEQPKVAGKWEFPIDNGTVSIPVVSRIGQLPPPTVGEIKELLDAAGLTQGDVVPVEASPQKPHAVLTVKNQAGRDFAVYLFDCWWCFKESGPAEFSLPNPWLDAIRINETTVEGSFKAFDRLKSMSGYFVLFIEYVEGGDRKRQKIGVYNLFDPSLPPLTIGMGQNPSRPFTVTPPPKEISQ